MKYLIYVRKANPFNKDYPLQYVYSYEGDPFHAMGEIQFRSLEQILWMDPNNDTESSRNYFREQGIKITPWIDKYKEVNIYEHF